MKVGRFVLMCLERGDATFKNDVNKASSHGDPIRLSPIFILPPSPPTPSHPSLQPTLKDSKQDTLAVQSLQPTLKDSKQDPPAVQRLINKEAAVTELTPSDWIQQLGTRRGRGGEEEGHLNDFRDIVWKKRR
ncbi:hypothetical protein RRG08_004421 [Elysia crispata]|uniref:Uncharacterized protein n=1 Tax=Elysia crispata TaxID=231223 RepID=A0AAE1CSZ8_9GAST|nr:hypothetical protein RRG08_004421 [Elysia crispata]